MDNFSIRFTQSKNENIKFFPKALEKLGFIIVSNREKPGELKILNVNTGERIKIPGYSRVYGIADDGTITAATLQSRKTVADVSKSLISSEVYYAYCIIKVDFEKRTFNIIELKDENNKLLKCDGAELKPFGENFYTTYEKIITPQEREYYIVSKDGTVMPEIYGRVEFIGKDALIGYYKVPHDGINGKLFSKTYGVFELYEVCTADTNGNRPILTANREWIMLENDGKVSRFSAINSTEQMPKSQVDTQSNLPDKIPLPQPHKIVGDLVVVQKNDILNDVYAYDSEKNKFYVMIPSCIHKEINGLHVFQPTNTILWTLYDEKTRRILSDRSIREYEFHNNLLIVTALEDDGDRTLQGCYRRTTDGYEEVEEVGDKTIRYVKDNSVIVAKEGIEYLLNIPDNDIPTPRTNGPKLTRYRLNGGRLG